MSLGQKVSYIALKQPLMAIIFDSIYTTQKGSKMGQKNRGGGIEKGGFGFRKKTDYRKFRFIYRKRLSVVLQGILLSLFKLLIGL
jgi:hypothetical protein